jgi:hypothetical protein
MHGRAGDEKPKIMDSRGVPARGMARGGDPRGVPARGMARGGDPRGVPARGMAYGADPRGVPVRGMASGRGARGVPAWRSATVSARWSAGRRRDGFPQRHRKPRRSSASHDQRGARCRGTKPVDATGD